MHNVMTMHELLNKIMANQRDECRKMIENSPSMVNKIANYECAKTTALMFAILHANADMPMCRLLITHRADVNATYEWDERTPLHASVIHRSADLCHLLLEYGATVNTTDRRLMTSLHMAVMNSDITTTRLLVDYQADVNRQDNNGRTPLHHGVANRDDICRFLIEQNADVNALDDDQFTPLDTALLDHPEDAPIVEYLQDAGATVNVMRLECS